MSEDKYRGLKQYEFEMLSTYNSEKNRGIVHTSGWRDKMLGLQARWDQFEAQWDQLSKWGDDIVARGE